MNPTTNREERDSLRAGGAAIEELCKRVADACAAGTRLRIVGGGTKSFYGRSVQGELLRTGELAGVVSYAPSELVVTALAGTRLAHLESTLAERGQMLAFEPPYFGEAATLGGTLACGFSGPRRPFAGSARDFVLGMRCVNGKGELLRFGGQVMKNVAGYDVARLLVGSLGTLGVIVEASLKVLPKPELEQTLRFDMPVGAAIDSMNRWSGRPLPLSAAAYYADALWVRLSGAAAAVEAAHAQLGGALFDDGGRFWHELREHRLEYFGDERPLWRLSVPAALGHLPIAGDWLIDWAGAQRWLKSTAPAAAVRAAAMAVGGHATLFRGAAVGADVFTPLAPAAMRVHRELKLRFDPRGILNAGAMYADL